MCTITKLTVHIANQRPVARSLVSANRWLRGIKTYQFPCRVFTLVSANHASSNPGQAWSEATRRNLKGLCHTKCDDEILSHPKCQKSRIKHFNNHLNPEKNPRSREGNRREPTQTQPTCGIRSGNRTWATLVGGECSHHCAIPASQG